MGDGRSRVPLGWVIALLGAVLLAALPAVWASPLAEPLRQTIVTPVPSPTPKSMEGILLAPGEATTVTETIKNQGTETMEGYVIRLEEVEGIEYLVDGTVLTAPYTIAVPELAPGEQVDISYDVRLKRDDPSVLPCTRYVIDVYLECGDLVSLIDQIYIDSPCPILPSVGK